MERRSTSIVSNMDIYICIYNYMYLIICILNLLNPIFNTFMSGVLHIGLSAVVRIALAIPGTLSP